MEENSHSLKFDNAQLATGVRLHYAVQGDSNGPPIIFLHGYTDSWFSFSRIFPYLSKSFRSFAISQRGHGDSEKPTGAYSMLGMAEDILAFIESMNLQKVTLVGHSMGSLVAQEVALFAPEHLARLVLVGSATNLRSEELFEMQRHVDGLSDPVPQEFARAFQVSTIYHPIPEDFLNQVISESLKLTAHVWREALRGQLEFDTTARVKQIKVPTLVLRGDRDEIFPRDAQQATEAIPNAVFKLYAETGHALHWERPREFVADLEEFIKRTS